MKSAKQTTPGGYKFAPLVASQQGRANQHKPTCFGLSSPCLVLPVTFGHTTACRSPAMTFSAAIHFALQRSAPCSAVLRLPPSSWVAVVHWSALMPKALGSSRKHPIHSFFWSPTQPASPTNSTNIRNSEVLYPPCAAQIQQTRSASCVESPRCSHRRVLASIDAMKGHCFIRELYC